jgi:multiple sugar transport system permease protein
MKNSQPIGRTIFAGASNLIIIVIGLAMLYPVIWLIAASFKQSNTIFSTLSLLPANPTLDNFRNGWQGVGIATFGTYFKNSFLICILCVIANAIVCPLTAYAFARLEFKGKKFWFAIMMLTLMLPGHATLIPRYIIFNALHWVNTFLPLIIPKLFATDAFFIFLLVQFIRGLPRDLDESARIDGCSKLGIFAKIILPLTVPAIITTVLFTFLWTWDDFFNQLLYLNKPELTTVPMGLRLFIDSSGLSSWGSMFAMAVVSLIPSFILFFTLQKYFVQGIATTGMKG